MKIIGTNALSGIVKLQNGYQAKLDSERLTDPPRFFIYKSSFVFWHKPKNLPMTEEERMELINSLRKSHQKGILVLKESMKNNILGFIKKMVVLDYTI